MKVLLDISDNSKAPFFMELIRSLNYVKVIKEVKDDSKMEQLLQDWTEAFNDIKLHQEGKKALKSARNLLDEL